MPSERGQGMVDPSSETAYLMCRRCGWILPLPNTPEDERCSECDDTFEVVDDHVLADA